MWVGVDRRKHVVTHIFNKGVNWYFVITVRSYVWYKDTGLPSDLPGQVFFTNLKIS